jgi:hypothetical protein
MTMRRQVVDAVRTFDPTATLEGRSIRLHDGSTLPNERRALQWVVATYQHRARSPRDAALVDPELAGALGQLEAGLGSVEVLEVHPNEEGRDEPASHRRQ